MDTTDFTYSIIIPHYNSSTSLIRMLDSIPKRNDIQVIVIDDCSSLEEVAALQKINRNNLEIYYQNDNKGAGHARNVGLNYVRGKWAIYADSDDIFSDGAFSILDKYKDKELDYLCYRTQVVEGEGKPEEKNVADSSVRAFLKCRNKFTTNLFKYRNMVCWNKMVAVSFIKQYSLHFEESKVNNDVLYNYMIGYYAKSFEVIPDVLYNFVGKSNSITREQRSIEREFLFYIQAQKRNGFYKKLGLIYYPFYRHDILYIPHMIRKHNVLFAINFFIYRMKHIHEVKEAKSAYLFIFKE